MRWPARWTSTCHRSHRADKDGKDVYLKDIWPTRRRSRNWWRKTVTREAFIEKYADVFKGDEKWQGVEVTEAETYDWPATSTYIQNPPYFQGMGAEPGTISNIEGAKVLAILGDMVTTDHISPRGPSRTPRPPAST
jgi:aconitate hydratase